MHGKLNRKLRAARKAKCWSLEDAAEQVGVALQTYFRWERGQQIPHPHSLALLCKVFNVTNPRDLGF
jgi:transcriptional regulator with XRE-family HTH domain